MLTILGEKLRTLPLRGGWEEAHACKSGIRVASLTTLLMIAPALSVIKSAGTMLGKYCHRWEAQKPRHLGNQEVRRAICATASRCLPTRPFKSVINLWSSGTVWARSHQGYSSHTIGWRDEKVARDKIASRLEHHFHHESNLAGFRVNHFKRVGKKHMPGFGIEIGKELRIRCSEFGHVAAHADCMFMDKSELHVFCLCCY